MIKVVTFLFFLITFSFASKQLSRYNFKNDLENLKYLLNTNQDVRPLLNSFNRDTYQLFNNPTPPSTKTITEYISIKEEIICLLLNDSTIDLRIVEFEPFHRALLEEILKYQSYFKKETLHFIVIFLFKSSSSDTARYIRKIGAKLLMNFTQEQLDTFISSGLFQDNSTKSEIDESISELSSSSDPEQVFSIFFQVSNEKLKISSDSEDLLADLLEIFDFNIHPDWLVPILETLKYLFSKGDKSKKFTMSVTEFIFSENTINILKDMEVNEIYSLLIYYTSREAQSFKEKLECLPAELRQALNPYENILSTANKLHKLFQFITELNDNSNEMAFKLANSAMGKLLLLKYESEFVEQSLILEYDLFKKSLGNFASIYTNAYHPLCHLSWKVAGFIGFLYYDLADNYKLLRDCSINLVTGFGHALLKEDLNSFLNSIIFPDRLYSIIDKAVDSTLKSIKEQNIPFLYSHLQAAIKFIELHPSIESRNSFIDQFCVQFISDVPTQFNKYPSIENIEISNRHSVYVTSFLTFLENYVLNPCESKLPYLREFYSFLKESDLLSKTESIFIENHFKGFRKLGKK